MIESNIIKRFIVKTFMQHSRAELDDVAAVAMSVVGSRFFVNESVYVLPSRQEGKVLRCSNEAYRIALADGDEAEVPLGSIQRRHAVFYEDVLYFLECITHQTAFGRILVENVNERIEKNAFAGQPNVRGAGPESPGCQRKSGAAREHTDEAGDWPDEPANRKVRLEAAPPEGRHGLEKRYRESAARTHAAGKAGARGAQEQLDISRLQRLAVPGYEDGPFRNLIKAYVFLASFRADLGIDEFSLESLGEAIREPEYASRLAFSIHSVLVGVVDADLRARKERYHESVAFIIEMLPEFAADVPVQAGKRRTAMTPENWKAQTKLFLQSLSRDADEERILQFCAFSKRDALALRLRLLAFLVDIAMLTERFRDLVAAKQAAYRASKGKHDELVLLCRRKTEEGQQKIEEWTEELRDCSRSMVLHPLRVHMGSYQACPAFVMDGKPFLKHGGGFYRLGKKDISLMLCSLRSHFKADKHLASNLKTCAEVLL